MKLDIKAKKRFGQNFLKDNSVLTKIIEAMPTNNNQLIEIGPGLGDLTKRLLVKRSVVAYEIDTKLCIYLNSTFDTEIKNNHFKLNCGDVLNIWEDQGSLWKSEYDLIANLPYYVATNIILKAFGDPLCQNIMVMVQKEVALKFSATPKEKTFSALGVLTQTVGSGHIVFDVPPTAFEPIPKVNSSILMIRKKETFNNKSFEEFLKVAFKQPRKLLLKNLSEKYDKLLLVDIFNQLEISLKIRPHETTTPHYHQIYKLINL